jgi:glycosyltransferase involved in cell wall biosynthesis
LDGDGSLPPKIRWSIAEAYALSWGKNSGALLFNTGHSGLDLINYGVRVKQQGVRPIFCLYDLIPVSHPEYCRPGEEVRHRRRLETMLSVGKGLIVNTSQTRDELHDFAAACHLDVPPSVVVPLAPAKLPEPSPIRPLKRPYFVVLGTIEARKNHLLLLHLWRQLVEELGDDAPHLVVIGQRGWECEQVFDLLDRSLVLQVNVTELPRCEDGELANWLAHAQALLFPSFVEGFGMPLVEALMLRIPVIASDLSVFREIAGDIPCYLNPLDGLGWRQAVMEFMKPNSLERKAQLARMANYAATTWPQHFEAVEDLLNTIKA